MVYQIKYDKRLECLGQINSHYSHKCSTECEFTAYCVWENLAKHQGTIDKGQEDNK